MPDKVALVTGGAVRLGRELALSLAEKKYNIALHYNGSESEAKTTCEDIRKQGVKCELFKENLLEKNTLVEDVYRKFSRIDVLVNSASWYQQATITETEEEDFDNVFAVNLKAPFFLMRDYARKIKEGQIINIIDNKISYNQFVYAAYLLTKKSLADLTKIAALEFSPAIRVNAISPGVVLPAESRSDEYIEFRIQGIPLSKRGWPKHIMKALEYLLENDFLTGQVLTVDGGENINQTGRNAIEYRG